MSNRKKTQRVKKTKNVGGNHMKCFNIIQIGPVEFNKDRDKGYIAVQFPFCGLEYREMIPFAIMVVEGQPRAFMKIGNTVIDHSILKTESARESFAETIGDMILEAYNNP